MLEKETLILNKLTGKFSCLEALGTIPHERRIYLDVPADIFVNVVKYASDELGFYHLCTITGLDFGGGYEFIYHISNDDGIVLNLKLKISKENPVITSVLPIYNGAAFYEKELCGILGIKVDGLPEGRQYPLPDKWPEGQYPMRKDWNPDVLKNI